MPSNMPSKRQCRQKVEASKPMGRTRHQQGLTDVCQEDFETAKHVGNRFDLLCELGGTEDVESVMPSRAKNKKLRRKQQKREKDTAGQTPQDDVKPAELPRTTGEESPEPSPEETESVIKMPEKLLGDDGMSKEELSEKLQEEIQKNKLLQKEMEMKEESTLSIIQTSEAQITAHQQQAEVLKQDTEEKIKSLEDRVKEDKRIISDMKTEQAVLLEKMAEVDDAVQNSLKKEKDLLKENEDLKLQLDSLNQLQEENKELKEKLQTSQESFNTELQLEKEKHEILQRSMDEKVKTLQDEAEEKERMYLREIENLKAKLSLQVSLNIQPVSEVQTEDVATQTDDTSSLEETKLEEEPALEVQQEVVESQEPDTPATLTLQKEPEVSIETVSPAPETPAPAGPSAWKRFRHALGLRKPKSWKRTRSTPQLDPTSTN
ncbi:rho-associated protein kinase 1-like [Xyrichtys novacula]|uniref:Rho-associated protein kinase 1-like n=1 Tax=Xyrichtys novacula TaxID=13765 RepID=A0AAV1H9C3_XYRNO|nr:rho-associated protein kinase 1-like [Xyrichtys novacula]